MRTVGKEWVSYPENLKRITLRIVKKPKSLKVYCEEQRQLLITQIPQVIKWLACSIGDRDSKCYSVNLQGCWFFLEHCLLAVKGKTPPLKLIIVAVM